MRFSLTRPFIAYSETLPHSEKYYVSSNTIKPFNFPTTRFEKAIKESFDEYQAAPQTEYFFHYGDNAIIEPVQGWCITDRNELIYESIPYSQVRGINFPSFWNTSYLKLRGKKIHLSSAISIRYGLSNYYHFLNDGMGQLYMLDELGISTDIPVVLPAFVRDLSFGRYLLNNHPLFKRRKIVFQQVNEIVTSNDFYFVKNMPLVTSHFLKIVRDMEGLGSNEKFPKKIFLTRRGTYQRNLANAEEVHTQIQKTGFTVIDAANLDVPDQINLFRNATHIVGVHGAGLTNLIFARKDVRILEVFPSNSIPPHFFWIASGLGMDYNATTHGEEVKGQFNIAPSKLIDEMDALNFI